MIEEILTGKIDELEAIISGKGQEMEPLTLSQRMEEMLMLKRQLQEYKEVTAAEAPKEEQV